MIRGARVTSEIRFQQAVTSDFLAPLSLTLVLTRQSAMLWAVLGRGLGGKELRLTINQQPVNSQGPQSIQWQGTDYCQQPATGASLEADPPGAKHWGDGSCRQHFRCSLGGALRQSILLSSAQIVDTEKLEIINVVSSHQAVGYFVMP